MNVNSEKMSKSLGNVLLVRDLLDRAPGEAIRLALLSAHYRAPLDWTDDTLYQAKGRLDGLYQVLRDLGDVPVDSSGLEVPPPGFASAIEDDMNTPGPWPNWSALARTAHTAEPREERSRIKTDMLACGKLLGLLQNDPDIWFAGAPV